MKFLAILKDSLRETLDVWLFYVMLGLSLLTVLLVASISYDPVTADRLLSFGMGARNFLIESQLGARAETRNLRVQIDVDNFQRTDSREEPWLGDYKFDYFVKLSLEDSGNILEKAKAEEALEKLRKELGQVVTADQIKREMREIFKNVEVTPAESTDPNEIRFHVVTQGTNVKSREEWFHEPSVLFGLRKIPLPAFTLERMVRFISDDIIGKWGSSFTLLVSIIVTAWFLPSMMAKGTVDMLIVKPMSRVTLLLYKFCGGLLFMFLNTVVILVGVWLVTGLRTGVWINTLLICVFIYTFQFAILYSVSAVMAVFTRSVIVSILASLALWAFLIVFGWGHYWWVEARRPSAGADAGEVTPPQPGGGMDFDAQERRRENQDVTKDPVFITLDVMHTVLPRYKDIDWLTSKMLEEETLKPRPIPAPDPANKSEYEAWEKKTKDAQELYEKQIKALNKRYGSYDWPSSLVVSSLFIALMLGLACFRFATKDY